MLCFNPYSIGFYSLIGQIDPLKEANAAFQSLFYWILFSYQAFSEVHRSNMRFQSLFYWILFSYMLVGINLLMNIGCFNPYSTGFSSFIP